MRTAKPGKKRSRPVTEDLFAGMEIIPPKLSGRSDLAAAIRYTLARRESCAISTTVARRSIANAAERTPRGIALGRKNYLFASPDAGGERPAVIYSPIEAVRLNGLHPQAYLTDVIAVSGAALRRPAVLQLAVPIYSGGPHGRLRRSGI